MDEALKKKILEILDQHRLMTVATNRPDGWPQATTVGYVNDDLTLYFLCSPQSQKASNLARDSRISLTIDHDTSDPMTILGLSMAAQAQAVTDPTEIAKALTMLPRKYPEYAAAFPMPKPEEIRVFRVEPKVISVLDYSKGFGTLNSSQFDPAHEVGVDCGNGKVEYPTNGSNGFARLRMGEGLGRRKISP